MNYLLITLITIALLILGTHLTGHQPRGYPVPDPDKLIDFRDSRVRLSDLAAAYRPDLYHDTSHPTPPLRFIWYEPVVQADSLDLTYYYAWENERHPHPLVHAYYSAFRAVYYGYPLYDVEYVQVTLSRETGRVLTARFETAPSSSYQQPFPEHRTAVTEFPEAGSPILRTYGRRGRLLEETALEKVPLQNRRLQLASQTWNHLHTWRLGPAYDQQLEAPLRYLTGDEYQENKFVRKSQGEHHTREALPSLILGTLTRLVFLFLPGLILWPVVQLIKQRKTPRERGEP
jgi:hypothetical protein